MLRRLLPIVVLTLAAGLALPAVLAGQSFEQERLRIAIPGDDGSLTPYTFETGYAFMSLIYDTLTWRDAQGRARPWLARTITRDSSERIVTVRLRRDVRWHDGRRLTAADVAFTYRYMADHRHPRFTPQLRDIEAVEATAPLRVRFRLRRPSLGLEDQPFADVPILPRHLWANLPHGRRAPEGLPIGTGPYRLTSHRRGSSYRFDANREYFRGTPSVGRIDVPIVAEQNAMAAALSGGRLDAAPLTVPPGTTQPRISFTRFSDEVSYTGTMLLFNTASAPFDRLAARRAVARALDLDQIAGHAAGSAASPVPADHGLVHPRSPWSRTGVLHRFDRDAARRDFAEQGIGPFRVAAPRNDPVRLAAARRVVSGLRRAGGAAQLVELGPQQFDRALGRNGAAATFDSAVIGIPALVSHDPAFLRALFGDPSTAPLNNGAYRSTAFDELARRAAAASTTRARRAVVDDQLRLLARELPAIPLLFGGGAFAYRPTVYNGWVSVHGTGILDKRSFLAGGTDTAAAAQPAAPALVDPLDPSGDDDGFSLIPIIGGVLLVLLGAIALRLRRRRA
jgi:peptide/nickel transport system substrate-binding protein